MITRTIGPGDWQITAPGQQFDPFDFPEGGLYVVTAFIEPIVYGPTGGINISLDIDGTGTDYDFVTAAINGSTGTVTFSGGTSFVAPAESLQGRRIRLYQALSDNPTTDVVRVSVYVARVKEEDG